MSDLALGGGLRPFEDVSPVDSSSPVPAPVRRARHRRGVADVSVGTSGENATSLIFSPRLRIAAAIVRPNRVFRLRGTFVFNMSELEDGTVCVEHRDLPVQGYGPGDAAALAAFEEAFELQWENLVERPADELTPHARSLRDHFVEVVLEVVSR